jgi:hypothetical protein
MEHDAIFRVTVVVARARVDLGSAVAAVVVARARRRRPVVTFYLSP